ncbi:MAG: PxKF domain-containing protein, partial [Candidatus Omnitrophica bacterium]|nr:PxKF domain-containing protein [Candidatus Omnitrophota bacterium]
WNNSDVSISYSVIDALSGVNGNTIGSVAISGEGENLTQELIVTDKAGNSATVQSPAVKIDKTSPIITFISPTNGAEYVLNNQITASWSVVDAFSGVNSAVGTASNGQLIDTATLGQKTFRVTATDKAGNTADTNITYNIKNYNYIYSGVFPPINQDGTSVFKLNRTVPVKFQLKDQFGNFVSTAVARIYLSKLTNSIIGNEIEPESTSQATEGNLFRYSSTDNQYVFNLGTKNLSQGTWQIRIALDDNTSKYVNISLRN